MSFVDKCSLIIKAGNGGNGVVAWRREAHVPRGGPAGGNGGNGGDIYFIADQNETSLEHIKYLKKVVAKNGENGDIKGMHGRNAEDVYIKVPVGTIIFDENKKIIYDFKKHNETKLIASGGKGGHGNAYFKSSFNKAPTLYERGEIAKTYNLSLELKEIADIGIIGFPNAGKSSLISKLTNAKPKIANYQFTTLVPILGTIDYKDNRKIILADIPGLIENASEGIGLGFEFLKHIERCRILIHLISLDENENPDIVKSYLQIMKELEKYDVNLLKKKIIIVANKNDVDNANVQLKTLEKFLKQKIYSISCLDQNQIKEFKNELINEFTLVDLSTPEEIQIVDWETNSKENNLDEELIITQTGPNVWDIQSEYLEYWSNRIPLDTPDNIVRYNQKLQKLDLEQKLYALGATKKDTIMIYGNTVELDNE